MGSGVRQGLNYDEVKELRVILPTVDEQKAIAAYLDEQCAYIDAVIIEAIRKDRLVCFHAKMRIPYLFCPLDLQEYTRRLTNRFFLRTHDRYAIARRVDFSFLRLISVEWCNPLPQT